MGRIYARSIAMRPINRPMYAVGNRHIGTKTRYHAPAQHIAEHGGCFQRRLFVCHCVCLFVRTITSERLNVGQRNMAIRCTVQKSRQSLNFSVKGQRSRSPGTKNEKLLSHPH